uniref:Transmembrane protein n=1 Tax=Knipowitschia caucasica TaxID=637954 RepID=A0AAV2KFG7_KNICA
MEGWVGGGVRLWGKFVEGSGGNEGCLWGCWVRLFYVVVRDRIVDKFGGGWGVEGLMGCGEVVVIVGWCGIVFVKVVFRGGGYMGGFGLDGVVGLDETWFDYVGILVGGFVMCEGGVVCGVWVCWG